MEYLYLQFSPLTLGIFFTLPYISAETWDMTKGGARIDRSTSLIDWGVELETTSDEGNPDTMGTHNLHF